MTIEELMGDIQEALSFVMGEEAIRGDLQISDFEEEELLTNDMGIVIKAGHETFCLTIQKKGE